MQESYKGILRLSGEGGVCIAKWWEQGMGINMGGLYLGVGLF